MRFGDARGTVEINGHLATLERAWRRERPE
jgi:hypothetical protein